MRIRTGIHGLDVLLGGGFLPNTVNIVLGTTGVGKTIFALQYLLEGLEKGEKGIFVSFDMDEEQIIKIAENMGWDIGRFINDGSLKIGKFFVEDISYLNSELLEFILKNSDKNMRIAIDSFTLLIASLNYEMRRDVNWFFHNLRKVGTTVLTLEEPLFGDSNIPSITIPAFLGDSLIHLKKFGYGEIFDRTLCILKHRNSWHAEGVFPYKIFKGLGIVVDCSYYEIRGSRMSLADLVDLLNVELEKLPETILKRIELALSEGRYKREEILEFIRRVVECYLY
jgi:KaiC/GvpD/RAD55 family RecA-like ATPase